MKYFQALLADIKNGKAKKAAAAAAAVLVTIGAVAGIPASVHVVIYDVLGVLGAFGVTYAVPNKA